VKEYMLEPVTTPTVPFQYDSVTQQQKQLPPPTRTRRRRLLKPNHVSRERRRRRRGRGCIHLQELLVHEGQQSVAEDADEPHPPSCNIYLEKDKSNNYSQARGLWAGSSR
jgi:hypothetical protein